MRPPQDSWPRGELHVAGNKHGVGGVFGGVGGVGGGVAVVLVVVTTTVVWCQL